MALGFNMGVKKIEEELKEQDERIEKIPEHIEVTQIENGGIDIKEVPEQTNLYVKSHVLNNFDDVASKTENEETKDVVEQEKIETTENSEDEIKVPISFDEWYKSADHKVSVRKAYKFVDELETDNPEVYQWVEENEDDFAKIWLGQISYVVKAIPIYKVTIENKGKRPNMLAKEADGAIVLKPYALLDDDDKTELTEEEIREDWSYLFVNGYARLLNEEEI